MKLALIIVFILGITCGISISSWPKDTRPKVIVNVIQDTKSCKDEWIEIKTPDVVSIAENGATLEVFERETLQKVFIKYNNIKIIENAEETTYKGYQYNLIYYK